MRWRDGVVGGCHARHSTWAGSEAWWEDWGRSAGELGRHEASCGRIEGGGRDRRGAGAVHEELCGDLLDLGDNVVFLCLGGEHALCFITMALALPVLLVGILYADVLVHQILTVHVGDGVVRGLEGGIGDKAVALGEAGLITRDLGSLDERAEA